MAKLWQKNYTLNELIESFTVGQDYLLDQELLPADVIASIAQAKQLEKIKIITAEESQNLSTELKQIMLDWKAGNFPITRSDEDCHTAIENRLAERLGETGKKIHTGRSRNDQVLTALRVLARSRLDAVQDYCETLIAELLVLAEREKHTPMPGRTHLQTGMPSSVGLWAGAWAEELLDDHELLKTAYTLINQCPLGSAAAYGVPLPLDREYTAALLGFAKVQNNVLYASNSRGKLESVVLDALDQIGLTLSRMAQDLILFSLPEFGYFHLPNALCSGSSIMPQKKNPDALELLRAKSATLSGWAMQIKGIIRSLPSGYNRDLQETKEPFFRALNLTRDSLAVMTLTIKELQVDKKNLIAGFTPDIFATDAAYEKVMQGQSFRDAYKEVGLHLDQLAQGDPQKALQARTHTGSSGNLHLDFSLKRLEVEKKKRQEQLKTLAQALNILAGTEVLEASGL